MFCLENFMCFVTWTLNIFTVKCINAPAIGNLVVRCGIPPHEGIRFKLWYVVKQVDVDRSDSVVYYFLLILNASVLARLCFLSRFMSLSYTYLDSSNGNFVILFLNGTMDGKKNILHKIGFSKWFCGVMSKVYKYLGID